MGTELSSNEISLNDGQNIFRVNGISDFEPKVAVENGKTVVFNITPDGNNFKLVGQSTSGIDNYPEADNANLLVYNLEHMMELLLIYYKRNDSCTMC